MKNEQTTELSSSIKFLTMLSSDKCEIPSYINKLLVKTASKKLVSLMRDNTLENKLNPVLLSALIDIADDEKLDYKIDKEFTKNKKRNLVDCTKIPLTSFTLNELNPIQSFSTKCDGDADYFVSGDPMEGFTKA